MQLKLWEPGRSFMYVDEGGRIIGYHFHFSPDQIFIVVLNKSVQYVEVGNVTFDEAHAIAYEYGEKGWGAA